MYRYGCEECERQPALVLREECSRGRENKFKTLGTVVPLTGEEPKNYSEHGLQRKTTMYQKRRLKKKARGLKKEGTSVLLN